MSGVIPQVAALMGPCAAGTAYIPGLADFVPMVKGRGSMALAGPHLVSAVDRRGRHAGGARRLEGALPQVRASATSRSPTTRSASRRSRQYLSFFPSNCEEPPPVRARRRPDRPHGRGAARRPARVEPQAVRHVRGDPPDRRRRRVPRHQAALGAHDHHLPRADGRPAGRHRRQPAQAPRRHPRQRLRRQGRALRQPLQRVRHPAASSSRTCPASWSARRSSRPGIIRHGAKMLHAVAAATVPKITVVVRKAYGAGYYVMCGRAYEPDLIVAWPTAEISVMGAEGAVEIVVPQAGRGGRRPRGQEGRADRGATASSSTSTSRPRNDMVDDVIDPRETRPAIIRALELAEGKRVERPWKRHGVVPVDGRRDRPRAPGGLPRRARRGRGAAARAPGRGGRPARHRRALQGRQGAAPRRAARGRPRRTTRR